MPAEPRAAPILRFEHVTVSFDGDAALTDVSFEAFEGESRVILGAAGSGKTVLLKTALGLVKPGLRQGLRLRQGHHHHARSSELFEIRSKIGMLFQESALFDSLTIEENVAYPLLNQKSIQCPPDEVQPRVKQALEFVELGGTLEKFPSELSGGMRRRAAIARAVVTEPPLHAVRFAHRGARPDHRAHHHGAADQGARCEPYHHADGDASLPGREPDGEFPLQFGTRGIWSRLATGRAGTREPHSW